MKWRKLKIFEPINYYKEELEIVQNKLKLIVENMTLFVNNREQYKEFRKEQDLLFESIENRVNELKLFIGQSSFDSRISFFSKLLKSYQNLLISNGYIVSKPIVKQGKRSQSVEIKDKSKQKTEVGNLMTKSPMNPKSESLQKEKKEVEMDNKNFETWKEIVFKIKLTPEEYNLLITEKNNKKNNINNSKKFNITIQNTTAKTKI